MNDPFRAFTRRASLALIGLGAAAASVARSDATESGRAPTTSPPSARTLDLADPAVRLATYVRIRCRLDGEPTFMPYRGSIFGKIEGAAAVPLFDVEGFSWSRARRLDESTYQLDSAEAGYFLDRETGEPLNRWTNPLNGLEVTVKHYRTPAHLLVDREGLKPLPDAVAPAGVRFTRTTGAPTVMNGHVWMHEDLVGEYPSPPREKFADPQEYFGPVLTATSLATWSAPLEELADAKRLYVPSMLAYQTLGSWRPFMHMGATPGLISWRMFGAKAQSLEAVPTKLRERVLREYPDFLTKT